MGLGRPASALRPLGLRAEPPSWGRLGTPGLVSGSRVRVFPRRPAPETSTQIAAVFYSRTASQDREAGQESFDLSGVVPNQSRQILVRQLLHHTQFTFGYSLTTDQPACIR